MGCDNSPAIEKLKHTACHDAARVLFLLAVHHSAVPAFVHPVLLDPIDHTAVLPDQPAAASFHWYSQDFAPSSRNA